MNITADEIRRLNQHWMVELRRELIKLELGSSHLPDGCFTASVEGRIVVIKRPDGWYVVAGGFNPELSRDKSGRVVFIINREIAGPYHWRIADKNGWPIAWPNGPVKQAQAVRALYDMELTKKGTRRWMPARKASK